MGYRVNDEDRRDDPEKIGKHVGHIFGYACKNADDSE
jgi:hypothetical protein